MNDKLCKGAIAFSKTFDFGGCCFFSILLLTLSIPSSASDSRYHWVAGGAQGWAENFVRANGVDTLFSMTCDDGATEKGDKDHVDISIEGEGPPPNSIVKVWIDGCMSVGSVRW